jgi:hypothetical protein
MPLGNFPNLQSMLQRRGKTPQGVQQAQPQLFQQMPNTPSFDQPSMYASEQGEASQFSQPDEPEQSGQMNQMQFNQEQKNMNTGMAGGKFNRRRF